MSLTWKPGEAHWCCYSHVCLLAFRTHQNQTGPCVMWRDQEASSVSGRQARANQWLRSHACGYEGEHLCTSAAYTLPACPPCRLRPVAESQRNCFWSQSIVLLKTVLPRAAKFLPVTASETLLSCFTKNTFFDGGIAYQKHVKTYGRVSTKVHIFKRTPWAERSKAQTFRAKSIENTISSTSGESMWIETETALHRNNNHNS